MKSILLLTLACAGPLCGQFTPDNTTRLSYKFPAFAGLVERKIEARGLYVDTYGTKGQPIKRHLFVVFDPASHYFVFGYQGLGGLEHSIEVNNRPIPTEAERTSTNGGAYVSQRGILLASVTWASLGVWQSDRKASSFDDAEDQAVRALIMNAVEAARLLEWPPATYVRLVRDGTSLPARDFYFAPMSVLPSPVKVIGIAEVGEGWEITLQGQYKVRLTLSPAFQPVKAERIDPPTP